MITHGGTVGRMKVRPGLRVSSADYGRGTIQAVGQSEMHIMWDKPFLPDSVVRLYGHDLSFAEQLTEVHEDEDGKTKLPDLP